ncbi:MAG: hypothetical protein JSW50_11080 [Candidatus Latescibacterota bacterium]|nr:MAG: hypothetical protein JSW50_11080 [Candidatus Latescibacterota bacterium]
MYSGRSGRTCDNCHLTPNDWVNPPLAERKCALACQACHVDPAGGGMRNASGRFYGRATLPMIALSPRPTADWDRRLPGFGRWDRATTYSHDLPLGPNTFEESHAYYDSISDWAAWGRPYGPPTKYDFFQGRYGSINADPFFRIGIDIRFAALVSQGELLRFPMQLDVPVSLHPIHHLTLFVNTGVRGQSSGYSETFDDSHTPYFRELFVLTQEWPYQAYAKAGRFVPSYGLRLDDHTSRIRREFELDGALPESRVTGVEVGAAPNYPFLNLSWFTMASRTRTPDPWNIFDVDEGWGTALNLGYRSEGWSLGGSALLRRRPIREGGDTSTLGVYGVLNPWYFSRRVPLTYQAEFDYGSYQRLSGRKTNHAVFYQELNWLVFNGVNLLAAYDWADPDREVIDDESHRLSGGFQITPIPGVTVDGRIRGFFPAAGGDDADFFLQLHLWW